MNRAHDPTPPTGAGGRAQREADERRRRARALEAEAARWEAGAEGERRTAAVLASMPAGWLVAHDAAVPGSSANLDHVVIGPAGVFLIDSKNLAVDHPIRSVSGTLFRGRYPMRRELETVKWEAQQVAAMLRRPVQPVLCFVNDNLGRPPLDVDGVHLVDLSSLVPWLVAQSPVAPHGETLTGSRPQRSNPARGATGRRRTPTRREAVLAIAALLAALGLFSTLQRRAVVADGEVVKLRPTTSGPAAATTVRATTTVAPLPTPVVVADYACPGSGQGWTLTLRWPESATDATHLRISWRRTGSPTWINGLSWFRDTEQAGLGGIQPGVTTEVMMVAVTPTGESPPGTAVVPAPAIPC